MWSHESYTEAQWREHPMHRQVFTGRARRAGAGLSRWARPNSKAPVPEVLGGAFGQRKKLILGSCSLIWRASPWQRARRPPPIPRPSPLASEVLELVRVGLSNRQIGRQLALSPETVRKHLENVYLRLNVQSRSAAVLFCLRRQPVHRDPGALEAFREPRRPPVAARLPATHVQG